VNRLKNDKAVAIGRWLARGLSIRETAKVAGVNRNTVLRYKKAFASPNYTPPPDVEPYLNDARAIRLTPRVRPTVLERLDDEAAQRGLTREQVSERILDVVASDDLFDAVLGE
jgi:transcriptional regulator with XRE-family HTH domain